MTVTIHFERNRHVRISDAAVEPRPPDAVAISASGTVRLGEEVLAAVAGTTLEPVRATFTAADRTVEIDLRDEASLRLDDVDVGVEIPSPDDVIPEVEDRSSLGGDPVSDAVDRAGDRPGVLAFTVTGTITTVPPETVAALAEAADEPSPKSVTFETKSPVRSDGGSAEPVLEMSLLGFGVVVFRDGRISVGPGTVTVGPR